MEHVNLTTTLSDDDDDDDDNDGGDDDVVQLLLVVFVRQFRALLHINAPVTHISTQLDKASTHKSENTHAGAIFAREIAFRRFDPKTNGWVSRTQCETFLCQFGDSSCSGLADKQTDRQTKAGETIPPRQPSEWVKMTVIKQS